LTRRALRRRRTPYYKLKMVLDIEDQLGDVVRASGPAFSYVLAKVLDLARIVKNFEETCSATLYLGSTLRTNKVQEKPFS